jgi:uncharacterized protein
MYTLAAHVHWAAEGARLAITQLLGTPSVPAMNDATSFADLHQRLDATIAYLRAIAPGDLTPSWANACRHRSCCAVLTVNTR